MEQTSKYQRSIDRLNDALGKEVSTTLQYIYFHTIFEDAGYEHLARLMRRVSIAEMEHIEHIAERILFLNGKVDMNPSYRAQQIVHYREQLGGFTHVEQLLEVKGLQEIGDSLLAHFMLDSVVVKPIYVNTISVQHLAKHPYLRFEQAQAIYELRRKKVRLTSIEDLKQLECIDTTTINKLMPYLNFDKRK